MGGLRRIGRRVAGRRLRETGVVAAALLAVPTVALIALALLPIAGSGALAPIFDLPGTTFGRARPATPDALRPSLPEPRPGSPRAVDPPLPAAALPRPDRADRGPAAPQARIDRRATPAPEVESSGSGSGSEPVVTADPAPPDEGAPHRQAPPLDRPASVPLVPPKASSTVDQRTGARPPAQAPEVAPPTTVPVDDPAGSGGEATGPPTDGKPGEAEDGSETVPAPGAGDTEETEEPEETEETEEGETQLPPDEAGVPDEGDEGGVGAPGGDANTSPGPDDPETDDVAAGGPDHGGCHGSGRGRAESHGILSHEGPLHAALLLFRAGYCAVNAWSPVMARPRIRAWMSCVPS